MRGVEFSEKCEALHQLVGLRPSANTSSLDTLSLSLRIFSVAAAQISSWNKSQSSVTVLCGI